MNRVSILAVAAAAAVLSACSALNGVNQGITTVTEDSVQLASIALIQHNCPTATYPTLPACYYARAQILQNIVTTIEDAATSSTTTIASLTALINTQVASLPVQDQAYARTLLTDLLTALNASVGPNSGTGVLGQLQQATITTVVGWILSETANYPAA